MALDVPLLRETFERAARSPDLTRRFYAILFERYPEVRPMFGAAPAAIARQEKMLSDALVAVVVHLEDPTWLQQTLFVLGAKHVGYGVRDEMYGAVGECLLVTLEEACGDAWSPRAAQEWGAAFGVIRGAMLAGAESARASQGEATERTAMI